MERLIIEVNSIHFIVHIEHDPEYNHIRKGSAYWAQSYHQRGEEEKIGYESDENSGNGPHEEFNDDCRKVFDWSLCYRGVWEDRIYMKNDEELWYGELREASALWDALEPIIKRMIDPNKEYED